MWSWIIKVTLISLLLIFLLHYLYSFFKITLTAPKLKDLVNKPEAKYNTIYKSLQSTSDEGSLNLGDDDNAQETLTNNRSRLATFYEAKIKKNRLLTGNYSELDSEFTS